MSITYYHGTNNAERIINLLVGNETISKAFHLTPDLSVARNYGKVVVKVELEGEIEGAHVGIINKDGNFNKNVGNGIEIVVSGPKAIASLYHNMVDASVMH